MQSPAAKADINVGQVRAAIRPEIRQRSLARAILVLVPSVALYVASLAVTILVPWELARPPLALFTGFVAALLFVIGHDAAHDALTPHRWLNALLGRLLFVPAWHPYTGWVHSHNHIHHGWTNLSTIDYAWTPLSKSQYDALPGWQRVCVRLFRWWPGFGLYYATQIYFARNVWPPASVRRSRLRLWWYLDLLFVAAAIAAQGLVIIGLARSFAVDASPAWLFLWAAAVPAATSMWLLGFLTYLHHTHPQIPWFDDPEEWSFYRGQVLGTTHTQFGRGINGLIHNIMEHTAHHADPRIPLYHLAAAQEDLETVYRNDVVEHNFTWRSFAYTQRVCQLYDYDNHRWLNYAGQPTSSRNFDAAIVHERNAERAEEKAAADSTAMARA